MSIDPRLRWACVCALALAATGCQDYNFNPVGRCLIQPGTKRVTLSNISSADVLFVVDDSGSMGAEQDSLAKNFGAFITNLDNSNNARASAGLEPFDFHLAVTTTAVYWNYQAGSTCSSSCGTASGRLVCCKAGTPAKQPRRCTATADCGGLTGTTCRTTCNGYKGEGYCCDTTNAFPSGSVVDVVPCSREGVGCGTLETHYNFGTCAAGVAVNEWPYPQGDFVSWTSGATANPRVLHFDKELYSAAAKNKQGFTREQLVAFFAGIDTNSDGVPDDRGNVRVGTCGSGQEQGFAAARRALEKAALGQQKDTYARTSPPAQTWDGTNRIAGSTADWLAPNVNSKLVLVFVGDEDDCSSPQDPSGGVVMLAEPTGKDACTRDATDTTAVGGKQYTVQSFVDYFTSLGRPVAAAFIESAAQPSCSSIDPTASDACTPGLCMPDVCNDSQCGGQAPATRFFDAASQLRARGAEVVVGSICDGNFDVILQKIAELVKPPSGLTLPTLPAAREVTVLRIAEASGNTRKTCNGPLTGSFATLAEAQATGVDWWFTANGDPGVPTDAPTRFVYINPQGSCIANPGETYSADYLGELPVGGCWDDPDPKYAPQGAETRGDAMCRTILGGPADSWTCFKPDAGTCTSGVSSTAPGTCICGSRANNCGTTP